MSMPKMVLNPVKPLLPPNPVSLRKNRSDAANTMAWVIIEKYTSLIFERKAKNPNIKATTAGTNTTNIIAQAKLSVPAQNQGILSQLKNRINSGKLLPDAWRIRYIPIAYPPRAKYKPCPRLKIPAYPHTKSSAKATIAKHMILPIKVTQ